MEVIGVNEENKEETITVSVAEYIVQDLIGDDFVFENPLYVLIFEEFKSIVENFNPFEESYFTNHSNQDIKNLSIELLSSKFDLSPNWEIKHKIFIKTEIHNLKLTVVRSLNSVKLKKIEIILNGLLKDIETAEKEEDLIIFQTEYIKNLSLKSKLSSTLGRIINK